MSRRFFRNSLAIAVSIVTLAVTSHAAQPEKGGSEPIVITADRLEAEKLGETVTFIGNVVLKKEAMTLSADRMIVYYDSGTKDIRQIDASGNVVVHKEGRVAFSRDAFYYSREEKIVLTGDARIVENDNELGGEKITLFLRDDRSVIEGGKVLLYQDQTVSKPGATVERKQQERRKGTHASP
jgi:lipopolysaccharide export system protein LptA